MYHEEVSVGGGAAAGDDAGVVVVGKMTNERLDLVAEDVMIGLVFEVAPIKLVLVAGFLILARGRGSSAVQAYDGVGWGA